MSSQSEPTKLGIGIGLSIQPMPPPSLTIVFGMRLSPDLNLTTCSVPANSSWCSGFAKHSSDSFSVFGQMRYL
jgi:hypothetical protein